MADSYLTIVTQRIVDLLVGNGSTYFSVIVLPANRISKLSGIKWPVRPNAGSGNLPRFIIECTDMRVTNRNQMKTFTNAKSAIGDVVVQEEHTFSLTFIYEGTDRTIANNMEEFLKGVLLSNPSLGITSPWVTVSGQGRGTMKEESSDRTGGTLRLVQQFMFPVTFEYHRADLVAMAAFAG